MVHTVGIVGVNGNVGAPTVKYLAQAAEEGKINLVVFHRQGSTPKGVSPGKNVEFRVLAFDDTPEMIAKVVQGVNFFISAVGIEGLAGEPNLVEGLAKSPDIVSFMPAAYSTTWDAQDSKQPTLAPLLQIAHGGWDKAKERGLGVTVVYTGAFDNFFFEYDFLGAGIKTGVVQANEDQLKNKVPITVLDHLARAITRIATADPQTIKNKEFSVVTFQPSGQDIVDLYTRINGKAPEVKALTAEEREATSKDTENFGAVKMGYINHWERATFDYEGGGKIAGAQYDGPGIEAVARRFV